MVVASFTTSIVSCVLELDLAEHLIREEGCGWSGGVGGPKLDQNVL